MAPKANESDIYTIGKRIESARRDRGLTQVQLAEAIGLPGGQPVISMWETGARFIGLENLSLLADALEVSTDWLIGREEGSP